MRAQEEERAEKGFLSFIAFLLGLFVAWTLRWGTGDLVWSLWLSSLFIGYATILSTLGAGLYFAYRLMGHKKFLKEQTGVFILIVSGVAIFLFAFFSLHFCGFHAGHAAILSGFFPLEGVSAGVFGDAFTNPPKLLYLAWQNLVPRYGLFLLSSVVAERANILRPISKVRTLITEGEAAEAAGVEPAKVKGGQFPDPFVAPYKNVIKTHCLLFFFAVAHFIRLDSFIIFTVAYSVYFYPKLFLTVVCPNCRIRA